ncbi:MAG: tRNA glutamyl-Q(34) synthetase GluQRS [Pseudomonadota bacterium]
MPDTAPQPRPVFRFAPSPNGYLHLGHALGALTCARMADAADGRFLIRIEDIDIARCRPDFERAMLEDLAWLGLVWEEPTLRQSERFDVYRAAAKRLEDAGLLYPCFASRREIALSERGAGSRQSAALDPDGALIYTGLHKELSTSEIAALRATGRVPAMRLDMDAAIARLKAATGSSTLQFIEIDADGTRHERVAEPLRWGDAVIQRKDVPTSYHLSVVVDDAFQGVTHVVRGRDLLAATDLQRLLQWLLGFDAPVYHHHRVILDPLGRKLSKSVGSKSLRKLRDDGMTAADVRKRLGF